MESDEEDSTEITRCPCGDNEDTEGFMIQCEKCLVWQHGDCLGITAQTVPEHYYCEACEPNLEAHVRRRTVLANSNLVVFPRTVGRRKNSVKGNGERTSVRKPGPKNPNKKRRPPIVTPPESVKKARREDKEPSRDKEPREREPIPVIPQEQDPSLPPGTPQQVLSREDRKLKRLAEMLVRRDVEEIKKAKKHHLKTEGDEPQSQQQPPSRIGRPRKPLTTSAPDSTSNSSKSSPSSSMAQETQSPVSAPRPLRPLRSLGPMYFGRKQWLMAKVLTEEHKSAHQGIEVLDEHRFPINRRVFLGFHQQLCSQPYSPPIPQNIATVATFPHPRLRLQLEHSARKRAPSPPQKNSHLDHLNGLTSSTASSTLHRKRIEDGSLLGEESAVRVSMLPNGGFARSSSLTMQSHMKPKLEHEMNGKVKSPMRARSPSMFASPPRGIDDIKTNERPPKNEELISKEHQELESSRSRFSPLTANSRVPVRAEM